ncbi:MAG TPA: choice-of-anchor tandem repeat GloVer-containing protein [Bryobacteraceae bacterium]|jgi:uncharacterized repeat protein (TIGR03803 family)|nr:choice-of-anchor tandem repeat GloVer-containing protein [Bryobacteraceae bacterium]
MGKWGPPVGLVEGTPGVFYSTGGSAQQAAFSITSEGAKTFLASFPLSTYVESPLVSASNQRFYSSVQLHLNPPDVFSIGSTPGKHLYGEQTVLPLFTQNLPDGSLLGVAVALADNSMSLIRGDTSGRIGAPIYTFPSREVLPLTALYASDGNYYGVSYLNDGSGYVYRVTPSGSFSQLLSFPPGAFVGNPSFVPLLQASDGYLYGATPNGGANKTGIIYKLTLAGEYTLLYTFPKGLNYNPTNLIQASDGNLYGATFGLNGFAQLFRITTSGQYTLLVQLTSLGCLCLLTQGSDGIIYGTAQAGGAVGAGAVFALDAGLPKPAPQPLQFVPPNGPVGTRVRIWGNNMLGASAEFGGVAAPDVVTSGPNYVRATVPPGAVSGPITITTPAGTASTQASFTVE